MPVFKMAENAFAGEAEKAGFETETEMQNYMNEIRKEARCYQLASFETPKKRSVNIIFCNNMHIGV